MNWKTVGIIALFAAAIALIWWSVKKARVGTDVKTGVSNDKIQKAAESVGVPTAIAEQIAQAPDSEQAARRIGIPPVLAVSIANGIEIAGVGTLGGASYTKTVEEEAGCVKQWAVSYDTKGNEIKTLVWGCPTNVKYNGTAVI